MHSRLVDLGASASHNRTKTMGARFCFQLGPKIPAVRSKQRAQLKPTLHLTMPSPPTTPSAPSVQAFFQKKYVASPSVSCFVHVAAAAAGAVAVVIFPAHCQSIRSNRVGVSFHLKLPFGRC